MIASDIIKEVAHDKATGQFTSGNGYVGTIKSSSGTKYGVKTERKKKYHSSPYGEPYSRKSMTDISHVHDDQGNHIGSVEKHQTAVSSHERNAYAHDGTHLGGSKVAKTNPQLDSERLRGLFGKVMDHHERTKAKTMTVSDLLKRGPIFVADLLKADGDIATPAATSAVHEFPNSFEDSLSRIKGPVCAGSGCENKPEYDEKGNAKMETPGPTPLSSGESKAPHYQHVLATYPDHAFVRCADEDKVYKVPYSFDGNSVSTAAPEEQRAQFVPKEPEDDSGSD